MSTKNTNNLDSWESVAIIASSLALGLRRHIAHVGAEWHLRNGPRALPVELVDALRFTSNRTFTVVLPEDIYPMTNRERAERAAEYIRRADPAVVRMLKALEDDRVPSGLIEPIVWALKDATDAVDYVERVATAHDAAMDELFNPRAST